MLEDAEAAWACVHFDIEEDENKYDKLLKADAALVFRSLSQLPGLVPRLTLGTMTPSRLTDEAQNYVGEKNKEILFLKAEIERLKAEKAQKERFFDQYMEKTVGVLVSKLERAWAQNQADSWPLVSRSPGTGTPQPAPLPLIEPHVGNIPPGPRRFGDLPPSAPYIGDLPPLGFSVSTSALNPMLACGQAQKPLSEAMPAPEAKGYGVKPFVEPAWPGKPRKNRCYKTYEDA
ncbi:MAG: DUF4200 domain-containing protein [Deltaproteobacteria bacterium]|nr:DUF4200 domain-containing protein [Deltaproteobacteria bacterium]